jgi:hypothetical protein
MRFQRIAFLHRIWGGEMAFGRVGALPLDMQRQYRERATQVPPLASVPIPKLAKLCSTL